MAKKPPTTVTVKTTKVGPRKIVELMGAPLAQLKFERTFCRYWIDGVSLPEQLRPGKTLPHQLNRLEKGEVDKVVFGTLNPDYQTFSVMTFERIII